MRQSVLCLLSVLVLLGCDASGTSHSQLPALRSAALSSAPPDGVVQAGLAGLGTTLSLYPYTRVELGAGDDYDPVNLVFLGQSDPRAIRTALLSLDGSRTAGLPGVSGYPSVAPFNCRWHDAIGDMQTAFGGTVGWAGSVIQLACGDFGPVRFHLRLFRLGTFTVGNAHFEMQIPGTADHQVLSWERAEEFVTFDLLRSGHVDPAALTVTDVINSTAHRAILKDLWNALASSADGQAVLAFVRLDFGSPAPIVTEDQPIRNGDGRATVLTLAGVPAAAPGTSTESIPIDFDQDIPRPFCAAAPRFLHVSGHIDLVKTVTVDPSGAFHGTYGTSGDLRARDLLSGAEYFAHVGEQQEMGMSDDEQSVLATVERRELPAGMPGNGSVWTRLKVGPSGVTQFSRREDCGD